MPASLGSAAVGGHFVAMIWLVQVETVSVYAFGKLAASAL